MSDQINYIDGRLSSIEQSLDRRLLDFQRWNEQADARHEKRSSEADVRLQHALDKLDEYRQQTHSEITRLSDNINNLMSEVSSEATNSRRHAQNIAIATIAGVLAVQGLTVAIFGLWITDQGSYAKSYAENQAMMEKANQERNDLRETTRQILDQLKQQPDKK